MPKRVASIKYGVNVLSYEWYGKAIACRERNTARMKVNTGKGTMPLVALVAIWSVSAIVSLPGLAISPILAKLDTIFPHASELEVEMLESLPSLLIIPFMLLSGRWSVKGNKLQLLIAGTVIFFFSGVGSLLSHRLVELIVCGAIMGIGAGMIIPLSTGLEIGRASFRLHGRRQEGSRPEDRRCHPYHAGQAGSRPLRRRAVRYLLDRGLPHV